MKLLKNIFIFILAFLFCLFMFTGLSIALGKEEITDYFMILSLLIAVITPVITTFFSQYNYAMSMKHQIASKLSDIKIIEERSENLLTQFNKAIYEAREHEDKMALKSIYKEEKDNTSSDKDKQTAFITRHKEENVKSFVEKIERSGFKASTEEQNKLLNEIKECANTVANFKIAHNEYVSAYNMSIYKLPLGFLRNILGLKEENVL